MGRIVSGMTSERFPCCRAPLTTEVARLTAKDARLRAGIEALHGAVQEFEPCPTEWMGCDDPACTESVHTGERYHDDQPTGRVCLTCRYEDGEPHDWPCETAALLNPPTEDCTCGFGGVHDDVNPLCGLNPPTEGETR